ncbi:MAG: hypothetical protein AB1486_06995 [Planctomycetota bacterium]
MPRADGAGGIATVMDSEVDIIQSELRELVDAYRSLCLWFLREDFYPRTKPEALRVLDHIQRHGDLEAFRRAGKLRTWLLRNSSAGSAG